MSSNFFAPRPYPTGAFLVVVREAGFELQRNVQAPDAMIGMTLCPEAQLAREREICYLPVCMVTDFDVWAEHPVEATDISATLSRNIDRVRSLLLDLVPTVPPTQARKCGCRTALAQAGL